MLSAMRQRAAALLLALGLLTLPCVSAAQVLGTVAGTVKDASGAVLPGVTVEVSSPALIEKVRSSVTDGSGQYRIINLPPGNYTITFTLTGFSNVRREGIEVSANFTATIDGELKVGAVEETITVSGESPIVDVQSSAQTRTVSAETFKEIPSSGSWIQMAALVPAIRAGNTDVGGVLGDQTGAQVDRAWQPGRRWRLDDRRPPHRQHVSQLEPDEHEPVAAARRSGGRAALGPDGGDRHQRRDHERHSRSRAATASAARRSSNGSGRVCRATT
jgi:hypothetical protein